MGIRLSEKHGVNPGLEQCFVCMKDVGVVLFGRMKDDAEAPRRVCISKEPCAECKKLMEQGVILVSVQNNSADPQNPYRTGGFVVMSENAVHRIFQPPEFAEQLLLQRFGFLEDEAWDKLGLPRTKEDAEKLGLMKEQIDDAKG
jgi:hypothetical protein